MVTGTCVTGTHEDQGLPGKHTLGEEGANFSLLCHLYLLNSINMPFVILNTNEQSKKSVGPQNKLDLPSTPDPLQRGHLLSALISATPK